MLVRIINVIIMKKNNNSFMDVFLKPTFNPKGKPGVQVNTSNVSI